MGQAYTPGLKVSKYTLIEKERLLPIKGKTLVEKGDEVKPFDIVASAELPGNVYIIKVAGKMGILPAEMEKFLLVKEGDDIKQEQVLAEKKSLFGLIRDTVKSPINGIVESISTVTGQCVLRMQPQPINVLAYIGGIVKEVIPEEGVIIKTKGSFIQGIFGLGGERMGNLKVIVSGPEKSAKTDDLSDDLKDKIIVAGSHTDYHFIKKAMAIGVKGIITAGIDDADIKALLGYEIGVAITGNEKIPLSIVVTEGFGMINMAKQTFELLRSLDGKFVSINGATQIRAGVIRPEIIATDLNYSDEHIKAPEYFLEKGKNIRIIRNPYFGEIAKVVSLPSKLQKLESEAMVRVVEVELENGDKVIVPRANVEIIEG